MSKIPKEIVDKIEQRNKLNEEIETWCKENLDMDGMDPDCADITDHHTGKEMMNAKNGASSGQDMKMPRKRTGLVSGFHAVRGCQRITRM